MREHPWTSAHIYIMIPSKGEGRKWLAWFEQAFSRPCAEARRPGALAPEEPPSTAEMYSVATKLVEAVYNSKARSMATLCSGV